MKFIISIALLTLLGIQGVISVDSPDHSYHVKSETKESENRTVNPLANLILNQSGNVLNTGTDKDLSRVKRQIIYDPYYYGRRRYYPYPLPIIVGIGGFGGFGGRGFGGPGFGGPGFGGRGFGGPGFGGRGFGGRGFGGGRGGGARG